MSLGGQGTSLFLMDDKTDDTDAPRAPKTQIQRFIYTRRDMPGGPLEIIPPEESMWCIFYVRNFYSNEDAKLQKAFCNRFRLPYNQYLKLVEDICLNDLFDRWCGYKSKNKMVAPVELLHLGFLCYLGRGWTFDNCEESTAIDKDVHRVFSVFFLSSAVQFFTKNGY
jgi:hypothetical protein